MIKTFFEFICDYTNQVIQKMYSVIDLKVSVGTSPVTFLGKRFISKQAALFWIFVADRFYNIFFQSSEVFSKEFTKHFK